MTTIQSYLPIDRRFALALGIPLADRNHGAALFADISGFTSLTAVLYSELGSRRGAETLIAQLDRVYAALVAEIHSFGGAAINFSGDSITCWFEDPPDEESFAPEAKASSAALRAVACGLELQRVMASLQAVTTPDGTVIPLGLKVAIAAGTSRRFLVGDPESYVLEVLAGATLDRMAAAEDLAQRGEVIVDAELVQQLAVPVSWRDQRISDGHHYVVIDDLKEPVPRAPWPEAPDLTDELVRPWLLPTVYAHLQQSSDAFLAELRYSVTLFIRFNGIDYDDDDEAGAKLNAYVCQVQDVLDRYEGYLLQITMGDKGGYLHASFGAPIAHENDAERAAAAALEIRRLTEAVGYLQRPQIGISQGLVHSGAYGSPDRSTYGVLGNEVNISARLMSAAEPGQILVSERVAATLADSFQLLSVPPVMLKGMNEAFTVKALNGRQTALARSDHEQPLRQMIGRQVEQSILDHLLAGLMQGDSALLVVEGEAGMGKSLLAQELIHKAGNFQSEGTAGPGPAVLFGRGDAVELSTPYYAWRPVFEHILGLSDLHRTTPLDKDRQEQIVEMIDPDLRYLAPLLNVVLPLELAETPLTEQITGEARQDNTQLLLVNILKSAAAVNPLILILDDAHWLDSVSWTLTRRVQRDIQPLLLVLVARPMNEVRAGGMARLDAGRALPDGSIALDSDLSPLVEMGHLPAARHILLDTLSPAAIEELICRRLGVSSLPKEVLRLIQEKAEGHPFFSEELAYALRDAGLIEIVDGKCRLVADADDLDSLDFPNSIEGVITSRIDLLPPKEQLTVKVASVIGRSFSFRLLRDIYPTSGDVRSLQRNLDHLDHLDITLLESPEPNLVYFFKHILTQEVVYGLMTSSQQQQLHQDTAVWFEQSGEDVELSYPLIAHHYQMAGNRRKAAVYYGKAGENAFHNFANQEANRFLMLALELSGDEASALQRAHWHTLVGEASYRLTLMEQSKEHYLAGLAILGQPVPDSKARRGLGLAGELARQTAYRQLPDRFMAHAKPEERAALLEAAHAADGISEVYYNAGDELAAFYYVMATLNLAERAGPSSELIRSYANMSTTFAMVSMHSLAESYRARALAMAAGSDDLVARAAIQVPLSVYSLWTGNWDRAEAEIAIALDIYSRLGEWRRWGVVAWVLPQVAQCKGELIRAGNLWLDLYETALRSEDTRHQVRSRGGQFYNYLALGQADDALATVGQVDTLLEQYPEMIAVEERLWFGLRAWRELLLGNLAEAHRLVGEQMEAIGRASLKFDLLGVFATPVEVLLALREKGVVTDSEVKQGQKILNGYARMYGFARPCADRLNGRYASLAGKPKQAEKRWRKSMARADELGMPVEKALTQIELARAFDLPAELAAAEAVLSAAGIAAVKSG